MAQMRAETKAVMGEAPLKDIVEAYVRSESGLVFHLKTIGGKKRFYPVEENGRDLPRSVDNHGFMPGCVVYKLDPTKLGIPGIEPPPPLPRTLSSGSRVVDWWERQDRRDLSRRRYY